MVPMGPKVRLLIVDLVRRPGDALLKVVTTRSGGVAPILLLLIGIAIFAAGSVPAMIVVTRAAIAKATPGARVLLEDFTTPELMWIVAFVGITWNVGVGLLGQSVVLAIVSRLGANVTTVRDAIQIMPWLWFPLGLRMIVHGCYMMLGGDGTNNGLSFLIDRGSAYDSMQEFFWHLLWQLEPFFIWHLALVWVFLRRISGQSPSSATETTLLYGLIVIVLEAIWAVFQG